MAYPLVSVVIPSYNAAHFISKTVESVLAQSYPNVEVIVVDDGSTDDTAAALRPYLDRIIYHRQSNGGLAASRNTGMRLAHGEYIAWCDADDLCEPDRLLVQSGYLAHNADVVAVGADFAAFDGDDHVFDPSHARSYYTELAAHGLAGIFPHREDFAGQGVAWLAQPLAKPCPVYWGDAWHRLLLGNFMHPPTMMIRATARERAGWLREDLRKAEDWDYITRVAHCGPIGFIDAPLLRYRCHRGQMSSDGSTVGPLNCIRVFEAHRRQCAESRADLLPQFDSRLAGVHADAAVKLARQDKKEALRHLLTAVRLDRRESHFLHHLALILMPDRALRLWHQLRGVRGDGILRRGSPNQPH